MKVILEFNLPKDNEEHEDALNGYKYLIAIQAYDDLLRTKFKYENQEMLYDCFEAAEAKLFK